VIVRLRGTQLPSQYSLVRHVLRYLTLTLIAFCVTLFQFVRPDTSFAAEERSIVGGTVYVDKERSGSPNAGGGVRGVQVTLTGKNRTDKQVTDAKGGFSFETLPAGDYTVSIAVPQGYQLTTSASLTVKVDGRSANRVIDFGLAQVVTPTPAVTSTPKVTTTPTPTVTPTPSSSALQSAPQSGSAGAAASPLPLNAAPINLGPATPTLTVDQAIQAALSTRSESLGSPVPFSLYSVTPSPLGAGGVPNPNAQLRAASLEPLRYAPGRDRLAAVKRVENGETLWLGVPFRSQMDGSYFSQVNCGPASLSMALAAFGIDVDPPSVREYVNFLSGNLDPDSGTSLDSLAKVAREAGLATLDLYGSRGYKVWDLDLVRQHVAQGHPVVTLAKYQSLPGNGRSLFDTDHYIVITGLSGDDFIYNDAAFSSNSGYGLLISGEDLERAWVYSTIPGHAVALSLDGDQPQVPAWVRNRSKSSGTAAAPSDNQDDPASAEGAAEALEPGDFAIVGAVTTSPVPVTLQTESQVMALLDAMAAPQISDHAFKTGFQSVLDEEEAAAAAMVILPEPVSESAEAQGLQESSALDPSVATLALALMAIFLPSIVSRKPVRTWVAQLRRDRPTPSAQ
jgi:hypothetical protein